MKNKVFIIAEAGVNHNGDLTLAKKMIKTAAECGVDAVKFQTFKADMIVAENAPKAEYQVKTTGNDESHMQMIQKLELDLDAHKALLVECKENDIQFLSSPFDLESIDLLSKLDLPIFKIPSGEITNLPYLRKIGSLNKRVMLSTGMSTLDEVRCALNVLIGSGTPKEKITVMHCTSDYPAPVEDVNLLAIKVMRNELDVDVGYSDHTLGVEIPVAAVALGASIIEKHYTLDRSMEGPDHQASLEPSELKEMVKAIRNIEKSLGVAEKVVSEAELKNRAVARKSIVAAIDIKCGDLFTEENITIKRPSGGISPMKWDNVMGRSAKRDFKRDELIEV